MILFVTLILILASCGPLNSLSEEAEEIKGLKEDLQQAYFSCAGGQSCEKKVYLFESAIPLDRSLGQRILVVDSEREPAYRSLFFANKKRVLKVYRYSPHAPYTLSSFRPKSRGPKALGSLFRRVRLLKNKGFSLSSLRIDQFQLLKLHHWMESLDPQQKEVAHGEYIFDILADLNPSSQFVLGPFPELIHQDFCSLSARLKKAQSLFLTAAQSYLKIIKNYKINYVNLSYASSMKSLQEHNKMLCKGEVDEDSLRAYLKIKTGFLDALSTGAPSVQFFSALPNVYEAGYLADPLSLSFSAKKRENFLRISSWSRGFFLKEKPEDRFFDIFLSKNQRALWPVTDLYVNSGLSKGRLGRNHDLRASLRLLYFGFYSSADFVMSNSFAVPLALSYLNFLRMTGQLKFDFPQKIVDPLMFNELPKSLLRRT